MKTEKFFNLLKNGGIKIAAIYSISLLIVTGITYVLSSSLALNSDISDTRVEFLLLYLILITGIIAFSAGLYGGSDDIVNGKEIDFISYFSNAKKYFWRTLKYFFIYCLIVGLIVIVPLVVYFTTSSNIEVTNSSSYIFLTFIVRTLILLIFQTFCTPIIILKVLKKNTKGYLTNNFGILLLFNFILSLLDFIPMAGKFLSALLTGIYPLLVLSLYIPQNLDAEDKIHTNIG